MTDKFFLHWIIRICFHCFLKLNFLFRSIGSVGRSICLFVCYTLPPTYSNIVDEKMSKTITNFTFHFVLLSFFPYESSSEDLIFVSFVFVLVFHILQFCNLPITDFCFYNSCQHILVVLEMVAILRKKRRWSLLKEKRKKNRWNFSFQQANKTFELDQKFQFFHFFLT